MATKKTTFKTIPVGTKVSWHYRSAIGHGTVTGVYEMGTNADNTMYRVRETDHHPGEPAIVRHSGKALSRRGFTAAARSAAHPPRERRGGARGPGTSGGRALP
jgi:hypothetical protein